MARKKHQVRKTLLIVGEGDSEVAFLKHLRELYCSGGVGVRVTIRNAHGKGPENVIAFAARQAGIYSYDAHAALLDTDLTERHSYVSIFPKDLLDSARLKIGTLHQLLSAFEG